MIEKPIERTAVECPDWFEKTVGETFHPGLAMTRLMLAQEPRAHERRERERDQARRENRHDDRDRELTENSPEKSRHECEGNEHSRERERHGQNRERNFAGAIERRAVNGFAVFRPTDDVFQEDDRVVDEKADGECERHQREIVDGIIERPHDEKRQEDR